MKKVSKSGLKKFPIFLYGLFKTINTCKPLILVFSLLLFLCSVNKISAQSTIAPGLYTDPTIWSPLGVPSNSANVTINHNISLPATPVTVNSITLSTNGILTVSSSTGTLTANNALTISGGTLSNTGGTITVGTAANNKTLTLSSGSLMISGGTTNVNGNINMTGGGFTMNGGNLNVDPNSGVTGTSVAATLDILAISGSTTTSVSGGTITFVDPPFNGSSKRTFSYSSSSNADWAGNTMVFGGSTGTNISSNNYGFLVDTRYNALGYVLLGDVSINGGSLTNKRVVTGSTTPANGFDIGGNLTINAGCAIQTLATGVPLKIRGNIINAGVFYDLGTISFSNRSGSPNTVPQTVSLVGAGVYTGSTTITPQSFGSLEFDNIATPVAVTINVGELFAGGNVFFKNGVVDVGVSNQFVFVQTATATRQNGFMLRPGPGQMAKTFDKVVPPAMDSFTYYIGDNIDTIDYSPVKITLFSNDYNKRTISTFVVDAVHPFINQNAVQTDYISRYWRVVNTNFGTYNAIATFNYLPKDIIGTESNMQANLWTGTAWSQAYSNGNNNFLTVDSINQDTWPNNDLGEVTGRVHKNDTYIWKPTSGTKKWTDSSNWSPLRLLPSSTDNLIFNQGGTVTAYDVPNQTISKLVMSANTNLTLAANPTSSLNTAGTGRLTIIGGAGSTLDIPFGSSLNISGGTGTGVMGLAYFGFQEANIAGTLTIGSNNYVSNSYNALNCKTSVTGSFNNSGIVLNSADTNLIFSSGTYNHNFATTVGTIPTAKWNPGSSVNIKGYTSFNGIGPLGLGQHFPKLAYNCASQSNNISLQGLPATAIDTLNLVSTGTGSLSLTNGSTLNLSGLITYAAGKLIGDSGTINMNGTTTQTIPIGFLNKYNLGGLTVNNAAGVSLGDTLKILKVLTVSNGQLTTANKLILKSTSEDSTARVAQITSANPIPIVGNVTVERYIPAKRAYRFLSPSVTTPGSIRSNWQENGNNAPGFGTHITGKTGAADGFDVTATNNPSLYFYNNPVQRWDSITNTNANILDAGNAYRLFVRGDRTTNLGINNPAPTPTILRTYGTLKYGSVTYDKIGSNNTPKLLGGDTVLNAIGNPYASSIDWEDILKLNSSFQITGSAGDILPDYTVFDSKLGNSTVGISVTYNASYHQVSNTASAVNKYIQPGQAFFIRTKLGGLNPFITINESNKAIPITHVFRTTETLAKVSVLLTLNNNDNLENIIDGLVDVFDENASLTVGVEDSYKIINSRENIAIHRYGTDLCIEGRPLVTSNDSIPLKIWNYKQKNYYLKIACENFNAELKAFVKDKYFNTETPIRLDSITWLPFNIDNNAASYASDRFSIVFKTGEILPVALTNVSAYQKEKGIQVDWTAQSETNVESYVVEKYDGQHFTTVATVKAKNNGAVTQSYNWFDASVTEGINLYRIKITDKSGAIKYTQAVRVNIGTLKSEFAVYPNPVKGKIIGVHFTNLKKGHYSIVVYNNAGQKVLASSIEHNGGSGTYNLSAGKLAMGNYKMIVDNGDTKMNENIIIAD